MRVYQIFDVDEETPVQYCAVHPVRWRPEWGEPTALFREVDDEQQALFDAVPALLKAYEVALSALDHIAPDDCWSTGPLTGDVIEDHIVCPGCRAISAINAALAKAKGEAQ